MDKITLETDLFDRLEKASKFLSSLPTAQSVADQSVADQSVADHQPTKDISQSRFVTKDISANRKPSEIAKVKIAQPVTDKLEQDLIKELVSYFE